MFVQRIDTEPERLALTDSPPILPTTTPDPAAFYSLRATNQPSAYITPQHSHIYLRDVDCEETPIRGAPLKPDEQTLDIWTQSSEIPPKAHEETSTCSSVPFESDRKSYGPALSLSASILVSYQLAKIQAQNLVDGGAYILFYVIPKRKRNGDLNTCWDAVELIVEGDSPQTHRLESLGSDPYNFDQLFRLVLPNAAEPLAIRFHLKCSSIDECDYGPDGVYEIDWATSSIWTLRDGTLADGDCANEIGILLEIDDDGDGGTHILHYWDETENVWHRREFNRGWERIGIRGEVVYLAHLKRVIFVIQHVPSGSFTKSGTGDNLMISWPGAYHVSGDGVISVAEIRV